MAYSASMPREQRIEFENAVYHVMARGNRRDDIVVDDVDRERFTETLAEVVERSGWLLYAWVLMNNHYHLLFRTPEPNLGDVLVSEHLCIKGDWRKGLLAGWIRERALVDNAWLTARLHMGATGTVSRTIQNGI